MKPAKRGVGPSLSMLQSIATGPVIAKVAGSVKKLGQKYEDATLVLYNKANLQPIMARRPDMNGNYQFLGLNTDLKTFIIAFDREQSYNAVIQDNVVPK